MSRKGGGASQRISVQRPMVHVVSVGELGSGVLGLKWNSIVSLSQHQAVGVGLHGSVVHVVLGPRGAWHQGDQTHVLMLQAHPRLGQVTQADPQDRCSESA